MTIPSDNINRVAELMSQGMSTGYIREQLGMTKGAVQSYVLRIRKSLGWQAV